MPPSMGSVKGLEGKASSARGYWSAGTLNSGAGSACIYWFRLKRLTSVICSNSGRAYDVAQNQSRLQWIETTMRVIIAIMTHKTSRAAHAWLRWMGHQEGTRDLKDSAE